MDCGLLLENWRVRLIMTEEDKAHKLIEVIVKAMQNNQVPEDQDTESKQEIEWVAREWAIQECRAAIARLRAMQDD